MPPLRSAGSWEDINQATGAKNAFCASHLLVRMIILPRQARDKHREKHSKRGVRITTEYRCLKRTSGFERYVTDDADCPSYPLRTVHLPRQAWDEHPNAALPLSCKRGGRPIIYTHRLPGAGTARSAARGLCPILARNLASGRTARIPCEFKPQRAAVFCLRIPLPRQARDKQTHSEPNKL